jgi:hypothetical protein
MSEVEELADVVVYLLDGSVYFEESVERAAGAHRRGDTGARHGAHDDQGGRMNTIKIAEATSSGRAAQQLGRRLRLFFLLAPTRSSASAATASA